MVNKKYQQAFSLIECLSVLSVLGILLITFLPSWRTLFAENRALACFERLQTALRFARLNAILLGEEVSFCGSASHTKCDGDWHGGQIVITNSGQVLRVLPKIFSNDRLFWVSSNGHNSNKEVVFLATGFTKEQRGSFFYYPNNHRANALRMILLPTGKTRVTRRL